MPNFWTEEASPANRAGELPASMAEAAPKTSLWRSGLHTLGTSIVSIPLTIATGIVVARALGPAGKGAYELALATAALLGIVLGFSLSSGVTYVVARGKAKLGALALQLAWFALLVGLLAIAILLALRRTYFADTFLPAEMRGWSIVAISLLLIFTEMSGYWRAMLLGRQEIIKANGRELISRAALFLFMLAAIGILAASGHQASAAGLVWVNVAVATLKSPLFLQALRPFFSGSAIHQPMLAEKKSWRAPVEASGLSEVVKFASPSYLSNLAQFLNYRLDVFLVSFFAGAAAVGLYTLAVALAQTTWLLSTAAATVLLPRIAAQQASHSENAAQTARITRMALWVSIAMALLLALVAEPLVTLIYGQAFRGSLAPLFWLLPGIVIFSAANVLASYIAGIGKPRLNFLVSLAGLFVTVTLNLLLIPRLNIVGAAISSTASYTTSTALILWFFKRESGVRGRHVLLPMAGDFALLFSQLRSLLRRPRVQ
ncbi:polysaccharide biosynthesis C-terminal domain-containing protein [candidate division KSB1 bacterium]|nr:polysaccharide biosynthesis C-terminal domain-containing protein [candidate division KSB1 bacterium]